MATIVDHGTSQTRQAGRTVALVAVHSRPARDRAVRLLRGLGATDVLGASSVDEARRAATGRPGEYGIVEAQFTDGSGSALARDLKLAGWRRTVVLSTDEDPFTVRGALTAGVTCFLRVPGDNARNGQAMIPNQAGPDRSGASVPHGLSQRELDVLQLVADGHSNKAVGEELGLSALTVKSHLARIAKKVGTGDRAEMVIIALRAGVIS